MASLNKVMLIGRLTDNPEPPRTLPTSGSTVVKFRFAVGRSRKNPQTGQWENDPNPLYIDCEAFHRPDTKRDLVNLISQYCKKGSQIYIEGRLQLDTWDDKNNPGQKRSKHKVVVENFEFLDTRQDGAAGGGSGYGGGMNRGGAPAQSAGGYAHDIPDDMPAGHDMGSPEPKGEGEIPF
jgi:single-strand DNA-binding protein